MARFFLPLLSGEGDAGPPYGIEEGEEKLCARERMTLPLSQAVLYLETEVLPSLREALRGEPGNAAIQGQIRDVQRRIEGYRGLRLTPRSTPVLLEKGYYTEAVTGFSADGEPLVGVPLPVTYLSGTNLSRTRELVQLQIVRGLAGRGVCRALDEQLADLKRLESGPRGSSRAPSLKLTLRGNYERLRRELPGLAVLDDDRQFRALLKIARTNNMRMVASAVHSRILLQRRNFPLLDRENRRY
jgi:hypothetical protein